jgi:hypothetical protein
MTMNDKFLITENSKSAMFLIGMKFLGYVKFCKFL